MALVTLWRIKKSRCDMHCRLADISSCCIHIHFGRRRGSQAHCANSPAAVRGRTSLVPAYVINDVGCWCWNSHRYWDCVVLSVFLQCGPHPEHLGNVRVTLQFWHVHSVFFNSIPEHELPCCLTNCAKRSISSNSLITVCAPWRVFFFVYTRRAVFIVATVYQSQLWLCC